MFAPAAPPPSSAADWHGCLQIGPFKIAFTVMFAAVVWLCWRAWQFRELRELIVQAFQATMRITAMVAFILVGATCVSITFQGVDGNQWVEHLMSGLPGGVWGFLIVVNLFVFFLAFFLDFFEIAFIIIPMLAPVAQAADARRRRDAA
jgi:TRAP-type mannitol/chloroaromatic compound transport system permease large subunit